MARFEDDDYEDARGAGGGQIGRPGDSGGKGHDSVGQIRGTANEI